MDKKTETQTRISPADSIPRDVALRDRFQAGGRDGNAALAELIAHYTPLITKLAHQYPGIADADIEDRMAVGQNALWLALNTWNPARKPLGAYARKVIYNAMRDETREMSPTFKEPAEVAKVWSGHRADKPDARAVAIETPAALVHHVPRLSTGHDESTYDESDRTIIQDPAEIVEARESHWLLDSILAEAMAELTEDEFEVFARRRGLTVDRRIPTREALRDELGLSGRDVRSYEEKAFKVVRRIACARTSAQLRRMALAGK